MRGWEYPYFYRIFSITIEPLTRPAGLGFITMLQE